MQVEDSHNTFESRSYSIDMPSWNDEGMMNKFRESAEFNVFPFYQGNIDSLAEQINNKTVNEIEGIYLYGNHTKLLLVQEGGFINGYVYETSLKPWRKEELMLRLLPQGNDRYKLIFGNAINKKLIYNFEKFQDGFLMQLKLQKINVDHQAHHQKLYPGQSYLLNRLNDTVQYLKIGSFKSSEEGIKKASTFCDSISDKLNAKLLIVDLRGNSGGYKTNGKYFKKLLKRFHGEMVFLINFRTKSYAEIFTLQWKSKSKVTVAGMNTSGVLVYSRNYPEKASSMDGWFLTHFTDMGGLLYTKYENIGIEPDVYLDLSRDWIEQVLQSPNR